MLSFLRRDLPSIGHVLYPGTVPPPVSQLHLLRESDVTVKDAVAPPDHVWAVQAHHSQWGSAEIQCARPPPPLPAAVIEHTMCLTVREKELAHRGAAAITVRTHARANHVLRDRKNLLRWLRALLRLDGVIAVDAASLLLWSPAMLDDELAHDADLDIEALYGIHAVYNEADPQRVHWLHTHGLEQLGAFDFDILDPSPLLVQNAGDPLRSIAFAGLEQAISVDTDCFELAHPKGAVRFVPVDRFHSLAAPEHQALRDPDDVHSGRRAVLCDPAGGLFGRRRTSVRPSRFLSQLNDDNVVFHFSMEATRLMATRARQTLGVFGALREEFASLDLPTLVKIGYPVDNGGPDEREHLWFAVHRLFGDRVDATLANTPIRVSALQGGKRAEYGLEGLSDWVILSPEGPMSPRNIGAARRLRDTREIWQARIDEAKKST